MEACKSLMCQECKWYWPYNSIAFMHIICFNEKRIFSYGNGNNLVKKNKNESK